MDALTRHNAAPLARMLNVLLIIASVILAGLFILLTVLGVMAILSNGSESNVLSGFINIEGFGETGSIRHAALSCFGMAVIVAAYFFVITLLRRLVKTLLQGDPFVPENISRLRWIWMTLALVELCFMISKVVFTTEADNSMVELRFGAWFLVFVIAALAEVFRHGAELRRDAELTV